jgi:hypothetical protein
MAQNMSHGQSKNFAAMISPKARSRGRRFSSGSVFFRFPETLWRQRGQSSAMGVEIHYGNGI